MKGKNIFGLLLLLTSLILFILGFLFPILETNMQVVGFDFNHRTISIWQSCKLFFDGGEYFLGSIILFFTIIFPVFKYIHLFLELIEKHWLENKAVRWTLEQMNRWSMLDIFVVALIIINFKMNSGLMIANLREGTTFFAIAVILRYFVGLYFITHEFKTSAPTIQESPQKEENPQLVMEKVAGKN